LTNVPASASPYRSASLIASWITTRGGDPEFVFRLANAFGPQVLVTALGALIGHLTNTATKDFQPMNVNFGLFPPLEGRVPKKLRGAAYAERALEALEGWIREVGTKPGS